MSALSFGSRKCLDLDAMRMTAMLCICLLLLQNPSYGRNADVQTTASPEFFIVDSWIAGFTYGLCINKEQRLRNAWKRANRTAANDAKIWGGLFVSDPYKKFGGRLWETVSRFSWQLPQTVVGLGYAHFENTIGGNVDTVRYYHGATVTTGRHSLFFKLGGPAVTLSNYIVGHMYVSANVNNYYFQHEYGHYLQSQAMGIAWVGRIAIPNIRSEHGEYKKLYFSHDFHPTELDANRRAFLYFNKRSPGFQNDTALTSRPYAANLGWDFRRNPMAGAGENVYMPGWRSDTVSYVDYNNPVHLLSLECLRVSPKWYDYFLPIVSGFYNSYRYNNVRHEKDVTEAPVGGAQPASAGRE